MSSAPRFLLLGLLAGIGGAVGQVPSIEADGADIILSTTPGAAVNFIASNGSQVSLQAMQSTIEMLAADLSTLRAEKNTLAANLRAEMQTAAAAVPDAVNAELRRNRSQAQYQSNLSPEQALAQGIANDAAIFIGTFATSSVIDITISDTGMCSGFGQSFTLVGKWGVHRSDENIASHAPMALTTGTTNDAYNDNFQLFFKPTSANEYALYVYIPPWSVCGQNGITPWDHTTTVETRITGAYASSTFNPDTVPAFRRPNVPAGSGFVRLPVQQYESGNALDGQNFTQVRYQSNLSPEEAARQTIANDALLLVGSFDTNAILTIDVDDAGWCSEFAMRYMVHSSWGVHLASDDATESYPQVQSFGTPKDWAQDLFQWYFKAISPTQYSLWLYVPPWPICDAGDDAGSIPRDHTLNVNTKVSRMTDKTDFTGGGSITGFNGRNAAQSGVSRLAVDHLGGTPDDFGIHRNETNYRWNSNLNPNYAATNGMANSKTILLGKFSVDMVLDVDIGDDGWCSGMSVGFRFSARWGVNQHTLGNNPVDPRCFTFGSSQHWAINNYIRFYYAPVETTASDGSTEYQAHGYYLYLHMMPFPTCGSDGVTARQHVTSVATQVHGSAWIDRLDFSPEPPAPAFDFTQFEAGNQPIYRPIVAEVTQPR